jgi:uncharacterized coiled-coil protein SlyX
MKISIDYLENEIGNSELFINELLNNFETFQYATLDEKSEMLAEEQQRINELKKELEIIKSIVIN